jgi:hypothetical protein
MLKLFRRIEPSLNPEYEIGRYLTERGFTRIPALLGASSTIDTVSSPERWPSCNRRSRIRAPGGIHQRRAPPLLRARRGAGGSGHPPPPPRLTASSAPPAFFDSLEHLYLTSAATLGRARPSSISRWRAHRPSLRPSRATAPRSPGWPIR